MNPRPGSAVARAVAAGANDGSEQLRVTLTPSNKASVERRSDKGSLGGNGCAVTLHQRHLEGHRSVAQLQLLLNCELRVTV